MTPHGEIKETLGEGFCVLFFGDLIGKPGRKALKYFLPRLAEDHGAGLVIANGENTAGGFGLTVDTANELFDSGVDIITTGNHIWDKREILKYIENTPALLRPENYPNGTPGSGSVVVESKDGIKVGVINLIGRVFMGLYDDPFSRVEAVLEGMEKEAPIIIVDFHGEDTREKAAIAHFLDGRVSAVIGTHTHVQTADECILPGGTAYITDVGMCGPTDSVIGVKKEKAIARFLTSIPQRFETAKRDIEGQGVVITVDKTSGKSIDITRFKEAYPKEEK
jgi:metallophosphoesterase (TIGR00282 family)